METREAFRVGDVRVHAIDLPAAVGWFNERVQDRAASTVIFCTASTIVEAQKNPDLLKAMTAATLVTPDGMPLAWLGRKFLGQEVGRVYGPDLMAGFFDAQDRPIRHFFYGGTPEVNERLITTLALRYPLLEVVGSLASEVKVPQEIHDEDVLTINAARPDIVWVGLGHPKQEIWMHTHRDVLDAPVLAGVGAAFDFLSGSKKEAPEWMKRSGLQWLHRLASEPRRLWRRYLIGNTKFAILATLEMLSRRARSDPR